MNLGVRLSFASLNSSLSYLPFISCFHGKKASDENHPLIEPCHEKICLIYASNDGADQPALIQINQSLVVLCLSSVSCIA